MKGFSLLVGGVAFGVLFLLQGCDTTEAPRRSIAVTTDVEAVAPEASVSRDEWAGEKVPEEFRSQLDGYLRDSEAGRFRPSEIAIDVDASTGFVPFDLDVAIVVLDTSGSMRSAETNRMGETVLARLAILMRMLPEMKRLVILDTDGQEILSWARDDGLFAVEEERGLPLEKLLRTVHSYPYESTSDWMMGLGRAFEIAEEIPPVQKVEVFIVGDEVTGDFWTGHRRLMKREAIFPVNVLRGNDGLLSAYYSRFGSSIARFEKYSRLVAYLTGGRYLEIVPPKYRRLPETVALKRLASVRPHQAWLVEGESENLSEWEAALSQVYEDVASRFVFGENAERNPAVLGRLKVKAISENRRTFCYLESESAAGTGGSEFVAELEKTGGSWSIVDWKVLWSDE